MLNLLPDVSHLARFVATSLLEKRGISFSNRPSNVNSCWSRYQRVLLNVFKHYQSGYKNGSLSWNHFDYKFIQFVTWPQKITLVRGHSNIWVGAPDGMSLPTTLISLMNISIVIVEMYVIFLICHVTACLKGYVNLWMEASQCKLPPWHVCRPLL